MALPVAIPAKAYRQMEERYNANPFKTSALHDFKRSFERKPLAASIRHPVIAWKLAKQVRKNPENAWSEGALEFEGTLKQLEIAKEGTQFWAQAVTRTITHAIVGVVLGTITATLLTIADFMQLKQLLDSKLNCDAFENVKECADLKNSLIMRVMKDMAVKWISMEAITFTATMLVNINALRVIYNEKKKQLKKMQDEERNAV